MKTVYIIAGEDSGDDLGAPYMRKLKAEYGEDNVTFRGIGGDKMIAEGLKPLFPMHDIAVMGLTEIIKHLPTIRKRLRQTIRDILAVNPDMLVTIDAPEFSFRVDKAIKAKAPHIRTVHYVAPTVWAWRSGRAKKISRYIDQLLCLFPFEPPYFTKHGMQASFVGHPLTHAIPESDAPRDPSQVLLLPGSRSAEITGLLPVFIEAARRMPQYKYTILTPPHRHALVESLLPGGFQVSLVSEPAQKYALMRRAAFAVHASGTVSLELALCGCPMITCYKVSALSGWIGRRLIKTPYVNLVNILAEFCDGPNTRIPELLQNDLSADAMQRAVMSLDTDTQSDLLKFTRKCLQAPSCPAS